MRRAHEPREGIGCPPRAAMPRRRDATDWVLHVRVPYSHTRRRTTTGLPAGRGRLGGGLMRTDSPNSSAMALNRLRAHLSRARRIVIAQPRAVRWSLAGAIVAAGLAAAY